ncbi:MAG: hypothetical protein PHU97_06355 [Bacteroidales bacterium]|nr:hypothetical protein [Bacteroidales bacterium]
MDKQILNTITIYALDIIGIIPSKTIIGSKKSWLLLSILQLWQVIRKEFGFGLYH